MLAPSSRSPGDVERHCAKSDREIQADGTGHFEFDNLTAGQYQLTAVMQGFETRVSGTVTVNLGGSTHYDFKLHTGSVQQTVTVSGENHGLETDRTSLDTDVTAQQIEDSPSTAATSHRSPLWLRASLLIPSRTLIRAELTLWARCSQWAEHRFTEAGPFKGRVITASTSTGSTSTITTRAASASNPQRSSGHRHNSGSGFLCRCRA